MSTKAISSSGINNPPTRRAYKGSCHCGNIKYITHLTLPPPVILPVVSDPSSTVRLRKCNCSTCQKMGFFHVRLMNASEDFYLLSPTDPSSQLSDYQCFEKMCHWYFCPTCGIRCFAFRGESEVREVEVDGEKVLAWTPRREGWKEPQTGYLSVNAVTLESDQEGLDLKEWHEKGWIQYLDMKNEELEDRLADPHQGGMY